MKPNPDSEKPTHTRPDGDAEASPTSPWTDALHKAWNGEAEDKPVTTSTDNPDLNATALTDTYNG